MTFFSDGFRPFFLGAGGYAVVAMALWWGQLAFDVTLPGGGAIDSLWHAHELLLGFGQAALAGFLLTATPNWSGRPPLRGAPLIGLFALWLAGRAAMWCPPDLVAPVVAAAVDGLFLPALLLAVFPALAGNPKRQGIFIAILLLMVAGNGLYHADRAGLTGATIDAALGLLLVLDGFVLLLTVVGGRVVPAFTGNALRQAGVDSQPRAVPWLEKAVLLSTVALAVADGVGNALDMREGVGVVALLAAALHGVRLAGWQGHRCRQPIVWVLHVGYGWLVVGLALRGLDGVGLAAVGSTGMHALSVGAIGTMTLAVMSRAALGHTGRPLVASKAVVFAYICVIAAAAVRVLAGLGAFPASWGAGAGFGAAAALWIAGFGVFTLVFLPILTGPRMDRNI